MPEPIKGDWVRIISQDVFRGKIGCISWVYQDASADDYSHLVRISGLYGSDLVPFRRTELAMWDTPRTNWPACVVRREQSEVRL